MGVHAKQIQMDIHVQSCIILYYIVRWVALAMMILFVTSTTIEDNISLQDAVWQFQSEGGGGELCTCCTTSSFSVSTFGTGSTFLGLQFGLNYFIFSMYTYITS